MEYFRKDEIVAAGENEVLIRFLNEERNIDCKGLSIDEIHKRFPGYDVTEEDHLVYTYLVARNGKLETGKDVVND